MITYLSPSPPQVSDLMVMDVWQASLMRAFAQLQLAQEQGSQADTAEEEDAEEAAAFELFEAQQAAQQQQAQQDGLDAQRSDGTGGRAATAAAAAAELGVREGQSIAAANGAGEAVARLGNDQAGLNHTA